MGMKVDGTVAVHNRTCLARLFRDNVDYAREEIIRRVNQPRGRIHIDVLCVCANRSLHGIGLTIDFRDVSVAIGVLNGDENQVR